MADAGNFGGSRAVRPNRFSLTTSRPPRNRGVVIMTRQIFGVSVATLAALATGAAAFTPRMPGTLSGGVGLEERAQMMERYGEYNLHLGFAEQSGEYLAGVQVSARDENGAVVFSGVTEGPLLFAKVPPGAYRVTASYGGVVQTPVIRGSDAPGRIEYFRWPEGRDVSASAGRHSP